MHVQTPSAGELTPRDQLLLIFTKENTVRIKQKLKLLSEWGGVGRNIDI